MAQRLRRLAQSSTGVLQSSARQLRSVDANAAKRHEQLMRSARSEASNPFLQHAQVRQVVDSFKQVLANMSAPTDACTRQPGGIQPPEVAASSNKSTAAQLRSVADAAHGDHTTACRLYTLPAIMQVNLYLGR